jgi:hypothetical protein
MHVDARRALAAFHDGEETWIRLTPEVVADLGEDQHLLLDAIEEFESLDNPAGRAAMNWLRNDALDWDGTTLTYMMLFGGRVEGFYAAASQSVLLSQRDVRRLRGDQASVINIPRRQPATFIAWLAKHRDATTRGLRILEHAFSTATQVAELQGNIALVLDPYDEATAAMWLAMDVGFRRSSRDKFDDGHQNGSVDDRPRRLWMPLRDADLRLLDPA